MSLSDEVTEAMRDFGVAAKALARAEAQIEAWEDQRKELDARIIGARNGLQAISQRRKQAEEALTALLKRQWQEEES